MDAEKRASGTLIAIATVGCAFTGFAALLGGVFAFLNVDPVGLGVSLLAAAVSFGLLGNALLKS